MPRKPGVFIAFEGGEGSGKTTQAQLLADALRTAGQTVTLTREPGGTQTGKWIRDVLLAPQGREDLMTPEAEALLYAADRALHVANVIRPALSRGDVVVCDRFEDSSVAYQGFGRQISGGRVAWMSQWATGGLHPDLIVLLDIDPEIGLHRASVRGGPPDRIEAEQLAFHERVRAGFKAQARIAGRYLVIDAAELSRDEIAGMVADRVAVQFGIGLRPAVGENA